MPGCWFLEYAVLLYGDILNEFLPAMLIINYVYMPNTSGLNNVNT